MFKNFDLVKNFLKKITAVITATALIISFIAPLGVAIFPNMALAAAPVPMFGGPDNGMTGAPKDAPIDRIFDQSLKVSTVTTSAVSLKANTGNTQTGIGAGDNLCASVSLSAQVNSNDKITCNHNILADDTWYTFTITTGIQNTSNEPLSSNFSASFKTGNFDMSSFASGGPTAQFAPPPMIFGTNPGFGGSLPVNGKISVNFEPGGLNPSTSTMSTSGGGSVESVANIKLYPISSLTGAVNTTINFVSLLAWNSANKTLTITPNTLTSGTDYVLQILGVVANTDGNTLNPTGGSGVFYEVNFSAVISDTTAPTVLGMFPNHQSTGISTFTGDIMISFNKAIDTTTVNASTTQLIADTNGNNVLDNPPTDTPVSNIQLRLDPDSRSAHISPLIELASSTRHFVRIVSGVNGVKDTIGNQLSADIIKYFDTGSSVADTTKPFIMFGEANNFEVSFSFSEAVNSTQAITKTNYTLESPIGNIININSTTTPTFIEYEGFSQSARIRGLSLPPGGQWRLTVGIGVTDVTGNTFSITENIISGTVSNAAQGFNSSESGPGGPSGGIGGGKIDYFTMGTEPIMAMPITPMAGQTSKYRVEFKAGSSIPSGGKIVLTYPTGFAFDSNSCGTKVDQFDNNDINGSFDSNIVTFGNPVCNSQARTITLTTSGGATNPNDFLHFELQGIINSTVPKDFSTSGYTVSIKTYSGNNQLNDKTSMPFFLSTPGSQSISGSIFNDTDKDSVKDAGETGVSAVNICLGGPMVGFKCMLTSDGDSSILDGDDGSATSGTYFFGSLNNGFYHIEVPPITNSSVSAVGGFMFRDINLNGGGSESNINFGLKSADGSINVTITGGPANRKVDIFAFNPFDAKNGGHVVRETTLNGSGATTSAVSLPVSYGKWQVSVGPWMPKEMGTMPPPPDFDFMPPQPVEYNVTSSNSTPSVSFTLKTTSETIIGTVVDGSGAGISNVFVNARPSFIETGNVFGGGFAQTKSDGTFTLKTVPGSYIVEAHMPGMPSSTPVEVTVKAQSSTSDNNATADIYNKGALVTGSGIVLKIAKGGTSVSGRVLDEDGNAIAFAFVDAELTNASGDFFGRFVGAPSDSSGNYTLYLDNGVWRLRAFAPGFGELGTKTVTVDGANITGKNFQVSSSDFFTVSGTAYEDTNNNNIVDSGEGISGAFINLFGANHGNGTVTNNDGAYSIKISSGNNYVIEGFAPGKGSLAPIAAFNVTSNVTGKNLSIAGTGIIEITITGITDAFVDARDNQGRGFGTGSQVNGVYTLNLPASASGISYNVKANNRDLGLIGSNTINLTIGSTQTVNLNPPNRFTVSGTIISSDTACVGGVNVFLDNPINGRHAEAVSATNGAWSAQVPNGSYSLGAGKSGCIDSASFGSITVSDANVTSGANRTMNATDISTGITGAVTSGGVNVTTGTFIVAKNSNNNVVATEVDTTLTSGNNYTLNVPAGTWTVSAHSDGKEGVSSSVVVINGSLTSKNIALTTVSGFIVKEAKSFSMKPSQGGLVKNTDIGDNFKVNIPSGALGSSSNDVTIRTKEKTTAFDTPTTNIINDKAYEITPIDASGNAISTLSSSSGAEPIITIPYSESDIPVGVAENQLTIKVWSSDKQDWEALSTVVDTENNTLTASTSHFSDFAIGAPVSSSSSSSSSSPSSSSTSGGAAIPSSFFATPAQVTTPTTPIVTPKTAQADVVIDKTKTNIPSIAIGSSGLFTRALFNGSKNSDVTALQEFLKSQDSDIYPQGLVTGYYGSLTEKAVGRFQIKNGIVSVPSDIGYGVVGPKTRAKINDLLSSAKTSASIAASEISSVSEQIPSSATPLSGLFTRALFNGSKNSDVTALQEFLKSQDSDIYPQGLVTGYYGSLTEKAVGRFQIKNGIIENENSIGYGVVGPKTRAKVNSLLGQ